MAENVQTEESLELLLGEVAGEFFERTARGERPQIEEYARKYPELAEQIRRVIPALKLVGTPSSDDCAAPREFSAPQRLGDFQIIRELGRGGWEWSTKPSSFRWAAGWL